MSNPDQPNRAFGNGPTPGPWTLRAGNPCDVESSEYGQVAACETVADARLIAASPDLLAACKAQRETISRLVGIVTRASLDKSTWEAVLAGNAAIAKAEKSS